MGSPEKRSPDHSTHAQNCPLWENHKDLLTRDEVDIVVTKTVRETLLTMGIDTSNPIEMQRDFQAIREWRNSMSAIRSKGLLTLVGAATLGIAGLVWIGVQYVLSTRS